MSYYQVLCILNFIKKFLFRDREHLIRWLTPQTSAMAGTGLGPKPGARNANLDLPSKRQEPSYLKHHHCLQAST